MQCKTKEAAAMERCGWVDIRLVTHFKYLCQLHLLVVKDCMDTVNSLFGLMRSSTLGFLMQDRNQSSDANTKTKITNAVYLQVLSEVLLSSKNPNKLNLLALIKSKECILTIGSVVAPSQFSVLCF